MSRRAAIVGSVVLSSALALTGCGSEKSGSGGAKGSAAPLFSKLPAQYQTSKVIKVGSDMSYAPVEMVDNGKPTGFDIDLATAIGEQLGVKLVPQNNDFKGIITALNSKRIDIIMSAMTDNKDRQNGIDPDTKAKVGPGVDFVDYYSAGTSIIVKKGNPKGIQALADLCGKTVAYERGTTQESVVKAEAKKCPSDKPLTIHDKAKDTEALLEVKAGRADADLNDTPVAAYNAKISGGGADFDVVGTPIEPAPYGIAVRKSEPQLRDAILEAVKTLVQNGTYKQILDKYGATQGAIDPAGVKVNGGS